MFAPPLRRLTPSSTLHKRLLYPQCRQYSDDNVKRILASSKVLRFTKRAIKYSAIASLGLALTTFVGFEATHLWIEKVELTPEKDSDVKRWEWDQEAEHWFGDTARGGTDPALGHYGRHRVRAAWAAYNWGRSGEAAVVDYNVNSARDESHPERRDLELVDAKMKTAESFLHGALRVSEASQPNAHPQTFAQLLTRHASILERLGGEYLPKAKAEFERAYVEFSGEGLDAANIALRLGKISSQLGQTADSIAWWSKAVKLTCGAVPDDIEKLPTSLGNAPSSPRAQRILSTLLVSLSAFYAQSGNLNQAQALEEATLEMLRSIPTPVSLASAPPPHTLHALYLLHRSSLISIHLGEVLHAKKQPLALSLEYLTSAAESSERVALTLTGCFSPKLESSNDTPASPPQETVPLSVYTSSGSMRKPAVSLLRDAHRTSAEAWNLIGILYETQNANLPVALQCYERAVRWAGTVVEGSETMQPREGILDSEWAMFWNNYTRVKRSVEENVL